jgi:hypothetical protein
MYPLVNIANYTSNITVVKWLVLWLGREFLKITLSDLDREVDIDVQEIRQLIDDDPDGSVSAPEKDIA